MLGLPNNRNLFTVLPRAGLVAVALGALCGPLEITRPARAAPQLTADQAVQRCRESVGKASVQSCVRARVQASGGPPPKYFDGCRAAAAPAVQACVSKMMASTGAGASGDTAVSATAPATDLKSVSTETIAFVAPPRSAADVTAILDKQKPDPEKVAKLVADAEAEPPAGQKPFDLAEFYYKRAQARAALGRLTDAIADARLAVQTAQGADYQNVISRYEQFLYRRLREDGQVKPAIEIINRQIDAFAKTGRGRLFGLYLSLLTSNLQRGDVARADDFLARSRALLAEAQRWPIYSIYATSFTATVEEGVARIAEARGRVAEAEGAIARPRSSTVKLSAICRNGRARRRPPITNANPTISWRWKAAPRSRPAAPAKAKPTSAAPCSAD